jgi:hypothetical protein
MKNLFFYIAVCFVAVWGFSQPIYAQKLIAFPGAEAYGRFAQGGRGGDVYIVTNLNDNGEGSLRYGLEKVKGPRTIIFEVSGTIVLKDDIDFSDDFVTIAGQTAPGDGVCIKDHTLNIKECSNVIVRYIRVRMGDESGNEGDAINIAKVKNSILDHVTATWGVDGTMDTEYLDNFTLQWSLYGQALNSSNHHKGAHAMLMSFRKTSGNVSLHHNLFLSSRNRHPTLGGGKPFLQASPDVIFDFRNNVMYNWSGHTNLGAGFFNLINNYYRPGSNTTAGKHPIAPKVEAHDITKGFMSGTYYEGNKEWTKDNYTAMQWGVRGGSYIGDVTPEKFILPDEPVAKADRPFTHSPKDVYKMVLEGAGASLVRDAADKNIINGIKDKTNHLIDSQKEVGGWPELKSKPAPKDIDRDGMPDKWEKKNGLDPSNPDDRNGDSDKDGYTNLEEYLNGLVEN